MADLLSSFLLLFTIFLLFYIAYGFFTKADADFTLRRHSLKPDFFKGKVVWVTGASSGIGEELCKQLSPLGAKLILSARNKQKLESVAKQLARPENARVLVLDMMEKDTFGVAVNKALIMFGQINILVNNAGVWTVSEFMDFEEEPSKRLFEINFLNTVLLTKRVINVMMNQTTSLASSGGDIVNVSSISGKGGNTKRHYYGASKAALLSMMDSLRVDFCEDNINFINILPGPVRTPISRNALTDNGSRYRFNDPDFWRNGMEVQRCCQLMLVAISNRLNESWISTQPDLYRTYLAQYAPSIQNYIAMYKKRNRQ